jgi:hypothetical protein
MGGETGKPSIASSTKLNRREQGYLEELERTCDLELREMVAQDRFAQDIGRFPKRLGEHIDRLPRDYRIDLIVDTISCINELCLRTWSEYVKTNWKTASPDAMLEQLWQVPTLSNYLYALGQDRSIVERFPTLAWEDLQYRNLYADGARPEDYSTAFGCDLPPTSHLLVIEPQTATLMFEGLVNKGSVDLEYISSSYLDEDESLRRSTRLFPLIQQLSVGRQRASEPEPFELVFGEGIHRLVIANKKDNRETSREHLLLTVLTPEIIYIKNTSSHFFVEYYNILRGSKKLAPGESCMTHSEITLSCNRIKLSIKQLDFERS